MAPKKNTSGASSSEEAPMAPAEVHYMIAYFKHCTASSKPQAIDIPALGAAFDLKDKKTVMQRFNRLCDKFGWFKAQPAAEDPSTPAGGGAAAPKKKATGGGRKKKNVATTVAPTEDEDDDDAEGAEDPTPSKKRKIAGDDEA